MVMQKLAALSVYVWIHSDCVSERYKKEHCDQRKDKLTTMHTLLYLHECIVTNGRKRQANCYNSPTTAQRGERCNI